MSDEDKMLKIPQRIYHIAAPSWPELRFEYHPETKALYVVWIKSDGKLTENIVEGSALVCKGARTGKESEMLVQVWLRGYAAGKTKIIGAQGQSQNILSKLFGS